MRGNRGRRYDNTQKLNLKKVFATIIVFIVIIIIIISLKNLFTPKQKTNKDVSTVTTYLPVYENNKWGVIDNKGNIIINLDYDEMIVIPDETKPVFICTYDIDYQNETYKTKVVNEKNENILTEYSTVQALENKIDNSIKYDENVLKYEDNGKYGLIDFEGKKVVDAEYDNIYTLEGIEHSIIIEKDGKKGLFNSSTSEVLIEPKYVEISTLSEDYQNGYIVKNSENKYGIILPDKTVALEEKYDDIKNVTGNNYYVVNENGTLEIIDSTKKVILNKGFDSVEAIKLDNFIITQNGKYGVINTKGEKVIDTKYQDIKFAFSDHYITELDNKYGVIDNTGKNVIDYNYTKIDYIESGDFLVAEKTDFTTDVIDRNFNIALNGVIISELNLENGYLRVRVDDNYKYYNFKFEEKSNKEILTTNTLFLVKENGKYGYENKNGERIVDCIYDDAKEQNSFGYCAVQKDGLWGALKSDGTVVVKPSRKLDDYLYIDFISEWNRYNDLTFKAYTK